MPLPHPCQGESMAVEPDPIWTSECPGLLLKNIYARPSPGWVTSDNQVSLTQSRWEPLICRDRDMGEGARQDSHRNSYLRVWCRTQTLNTALPPWLCKSWQECLHKVKGTATGPKGTGHRSLKKEDKSSWIMMPSSLCACVPAVAQLTEMPDEGTTPTLFLSLSGGNTRASRHVVRPTSIFPSQPPNLT